MLLNFRMNRFDVSFLSISNEHLHHRREDSSQRVRSRLVHQKQRRPRRRMRDDNRAHFRARDPVHLVRQQNARTQSVHSTEEHQIRLALHGFEHERQSAGAADRQRRQNLGLEVGLVEDADEAVAQTNVRRQEHARLENRKREAGKRLDRIFDPGARALGEGSDDFERAVERQRDAQKVSQKVLEIRDRARAESRMHDFAVLGAGRERLDAVDRVRCDLGEDAARDVAMAGAVVGDSRRPRARVQVCDGLHLVLCHRGRVHQKVGVFFGVRLRVEGRVAEQDAADGGERDAVPELGRARVDEGRQHARRVDEAGDDGVDRAHCHVEHQLDAAVLVEDLADGQRDDDAGEKNGEKFRLADQDGVVVVFFTSCFAGTILRLVVILSFFCRKFLQDRLQNKLNRSIHGKSHAEGGPFQRIVGNEFGFNADGDFPDALEDGALHEKLLDEAKDETERRHAQSDLDDVEKDAARCERKVVMADVRNGRILLLLLLLLNKRNFCRCCH